MPDSHPPRRRHAEFRFYAELNDFLPPQQRQRPYRYHFTGTPSVKDAIEAIGVPHTEVDLVLLNGRSVSFEAHLQGGERVTVYPAFERFDLTPLTRLRQRPLRQPRFILDVHLGKLARYLRLLGFDTLYRNDYADAEIVAIAQRDQRIILTRDIGILKYNAVSHGYWLRNTAPRQQLREVMQALQLNNRCAPFTRCMKCNGRLQGVAKTELRGQLPAHLLRDHTAFFRCHDCHQLYWPGSHFDKLRRLVAEVGAAPS